MPQNEKYGIADGAALWEKLAQIDPVKYITAGTCRGTDEFFYNGEMAGRSYTQEMAPHLPKPPADCRILEYGCGLGRMTVAFHRLNWGAVFGVDVSPTMIDGAKRLFGAVDYRLCDGRSIPLPDDSLDVVFSTIVFQHMPHEAVAAVLADARRVLAPGGIVAFQLSSVSDPDEANCPADALGAHRWVADDLRAAIEAAGLALEHLAVDDYWGLHIARKAA